MPNIYQKVGKSSTMCSQKGYYNLCEEQKELGDFH